MPSIPAVCKHIGLSASTNSELQSEGIYSENTQNSILEEVFWFERPSAIGNSEKNIGNYQQQEEDGSSQQTCSRRGYCLGRTHGTQPWCWCYIASIEEMKVWRGTGLRLLRRTSRLLVSS